MGSFRWVDVKHVLLSSVTGEAALAGQGAERTRGEPSSLTKAESMLGIFFFYPNLAVPPISYNPHFAFHPSLCPINQPPLSPPPPFYLCPFRLLIKQRGVCSAGNSL